MVGVVTVIGSDVLANKLVVPDPLPGWEVGAEDKAEKVGSDVHAVAGWAAAAAMVVFKTVALKFALEIAVVMDSLDVIAELAVAVGIRLILNCVTTVGGVLVVSMVNPVISIRSNIS